VAKFSILLLTPANSSMAPATGLSYPKKLMGSMVMGLASLIPGPPQAFPGLDESSGRQWAGNLSPSSLGSMAPLRVSDLNHQGQGEGFPVLVCKVQLISTALLAPAVVTKSSRNCLGYFPICVCKLKSPGETWSGRFLIHLRAKQNCTGIKLAGWIANSTCS
jgi:hypothetical protein